MGQNDKEQKMTEDSSGIYFALSSMGER